MYKCRKCNIELDESNWFPSYKKRLIYLCRSCKKREYIRTTTICKCGSPLIGRSMGLYPTCKDKKWKEKWRKQNRKRHFRTRNMGFMPLNKEFVGSDGHHIDGKHIIYMPQDLHRRIPHDHQKPETMELINYYALQYLFPTV